MRLTVALGSCMQWLYVYYPLSIESKVYACVRNIGIEANVAIYGYSSEFVYKLVNSLH